jgi:hypothetical protein
VWWKRKKMAGSSEAWKWRSKNVISPRYWLMKKIMVGVPNLGDEDAKNVLSSREWLDWNKKKVGVPMLVNGKHDLITSWTTVRLRCLIDQGIAKMFDKKACMIPTR